jgi:hypothetical protein
VSGSVTIAFLLFLIFLTQLILRIENTKADHDKIKNKINISYPIGASNEKY